MTNNLPRAALAALPLALAACGGGGNDASTGEPESEAMSYAIAEGDTWVYRFEYSAGIENYQTRYVAEVGADGRISVLNFLFQSPERRSLNTRTVLDAQGRTAQEFDYSGAVCDYPPEASLDASIQVGAAFERRYTVKCGASNTDYLSRWEIQAREPKVTPFGTFDSYRYQRTVTADGGATRTVSTCWIEARLRRPVECSYSTQSREASGGYAESRSSTMRLVGHQTAAYEADVPHPARVAGDWTMTFSGPSLKTPRSCSLYIDQKGAATGGCEDIATVSGAMGDDVLTLQQESSGSGGAQRFVSTSLSAISMSGQWTKGTDSGVWTAGRSQR